MIPNLSDKSPYFPLCATKCSSIKIWSCRWTCGWPRPATHPYTTVLKLNTQSQNGNQHYQSMNTTISFPEERTNFLHKHLSSWGLHMKEFDPLLGVVVAQITDESSLLCYLFPNAGKTQQFSKLDTRKPPRSKSVAILGSFSNLRLTKPLKYTHLQWIQQDSVFLSSSWICTWHSCTLIVTEFFV